MKMMRQQKGSKSSEMSIKAYHCYQGFTLEEYVASEVLLSLKSPFQREKMKSKLKKPRSSRRKRNCMNNNNIQLSAQNLNVVVIVAINNNINNENDNVPHQDLPPIDGLRDYILECSKPFEKQLKQSDLKKDQNRLMLSKKHVEEHFLQLLREEEDVKRGIEVTVYDVEGNMFKMTFKLWAEKYYVLMGGWNAFFTAHSLEMLQDYITVWMFRHSQTNNLCFALSVRRQ